MDGFWTAFWLMLIWIPLMTLWFFGLADIFKRIDLSGTAKALWVLLIVFLPVAGMVVYFVARPADAQYRGSPQEHAASSASTVAQELQMLADLHDRGKLTDEEYAEQKHRILTTP